MSRLRVAGADERLPQLFWLKAAGLETANAETDAVDDPAEHAPAARLQIQDRELGRLCDAVRQIAASRRDLELLFIVTAAEGEMHGEQPHLPLDFQRLGEAVVHTPLLIQATNGDTGSRRRAFVQPVDLVPTLLDWFGLPAEKRAFDGQSLMPFVRLESRETSSPIRREFIVSGDGRRALSIRTQDYYLIAPVQTDAHSAATSPQLFRKPEDVWEVNDVAQQDPETVTELQSLLASATNAVETQETESTAARRASE
ncbi:MAG: hypothetical protein IID45_15100 [Planctomycetes bacterium]|nr:hypothetical protein [Planctomycetota bacterium]